MLIVSTFFGFLFYSPFSFHFSFQSNLSFAFVCGIIGFLLSAMLYRGILYSLIFVVFITTFRFLFQHQRTFSNFIASFSFFFLIPFFAYLITLSFKNLYIRFGLQIASIFIAGVLLFLLNYFLIPWGVLPLRVHFILFFPLSLSVCSSLLLWELIKRKFP